MHSNQNYTNPRNYNRQRNEPQQHQQQPNDNPMRTRSNTLLARRRSNRLLQQGGNNNANNEQPKLWSSLLKPPQDNPGASTSGTSGNQHTSETETMQDRIKELEQELARKNQSENNAGRSNNQSKNLQTAPRNGGGNMTTGSTNTGTPEHHRNNEQVSPMEVHDILQVISTTMATLKDFESRYRNARST